MTTPEQFQELLTSSEGTRVEFKTAATGFHFEELVKNCVALANEGGGKIIFGVTDKRPRGIIGTKAFDEPGRTEAGLFEQLRQRIPIEEYVDDGRRVLIVHVPPRLPGTAWQHRGSFWMRAGEALVPMSDEQLRRIHEETGPDFSADFCKAARLDDLDPTAVDVLRELWRRKSPEQGIAELWVDISARQKSSLSTVPTKRQDPLRIGASSGGVFFQRSMKYGTSSTCAMTCSPARTVHLGRPHVQRARSSGSRAQRRQSSRLSPRRIRVRAPVSATE